MLEQAVLFEVPQVKDGWRGRYYEFPESFFVVRCPKCGWLWDYPFDFSHFDDFTHEVVFVPLNEGDDKCPGCGIQGVEW